MAEYTEARRPATLDFLKIHGPSNIPRLAKLRRVNPTAVRQQLIALEREGLVVRRTERQKRGRPTHVYALTPKSESLFPQAYGPMALTLLRELRRMDGEEKVEHVLERRTKEVSTRYRRRLAGLTTQQKMVELARIRDEEGYMARGRAGTLQENHCPIAAVAREFPQVCRYEKKLFEQVIGRPLERTHHLGSGDRACVYALRKKK